PARLRLLRRACVRIDPMFRMIIGAEIHTLCLVVTASLPPPRKRGNTPFNPLFRPRAPVEPARSHPDGPAALPGARSFGVRGSVLECGRGAERNHRYRPPVAARVVV